MLRVDGPNAIHEAGRLVILDATSIVLDIWDLLPNPLRQYIANTKRRTNSHTTKASDSIFQFSSTTCGGTTPSPGSVMEPRFVKQHWHIRATHRKQRTNSIKHVLSSHVGLRFVVRVLASHVIKEASSHCGPASGKGRAIQCARATHHTISDATRTHKVIIWDIETQKN